MLEQTQDEVMVKIDAWDAVLDEESGPAAIIIRERLRPAAGHGTPIAPPTFAGRRQGESDYHCDGEDPTHWEVILAAIREGRIANRCTMDSIPSQANRMESALKRYEGTSIPKVTLQGAKQKSMSLLDVGHRVADAAVWCADGYDDFQKAIEAYVGGDAKLLARLAPTALVFGYWDSRGTTGGKARRLVRSEITADNVVKLGRRSQYWASVDPEASEELQKALEEAKAKARDDETKDVGSQLGFRDAPASGLGGIIAHGDIARITILSLTGLRNLAVRKDGQEDAEATRKMRRYLFALMLASASTPRSGWDLREGCLLVHARRKIKEGEKEKEVPDIEAKQVFYDGREEDWNSPSTNEVNAYVKETAEDFFGKSSLEPRTLTFNAKTAAIKVREKIEEKKGGGIARRRATRGRAGNGG
jgi:CRISPR-associated protein Csb1